MVNAKIIQALNNQIEGIHTEKTRLETQQEMLKKQLVSELTEYKIQFGVDLNGVDLKDTCKLINAEVEKVTKEVEDEYNLKTRVVNAINAGDYATAYSLLGIEYEEDNSVAEEPSTESSTESNTEAVTTPAEQGMSMDIEEPIEEPVLSNLNPTKPTTEKPQKPTVPKIGVSVEEEDKVNFNSALPSGLGRLVVEDDGAEVGISEDDAVYDFGFGTALNGTKFGN